MPVWKSSNFSNQCSAILPGKDLQPMSKNYVNLEFSSTPISKTSIQIMIRKNMKKNNLNFPSMIGPSWRFPQM